MFSDWKQRELDNLRKFCLITKNLRYNELVSLEAYYKNLQELLRGV